MFTQEKSHMNVLKVCNKYVIHVSMTHEILKYTCIHTEEKRH